MRNLPVKIWHEFQYAMENLSKETPSRQILEVILFWIRSNLKYFTSEPFSSYGFDSLAKLDERNIPVEYSSFKVSDLVNFKSIVLKRQARDVDLIARLVRDTIEELATVEVEEQCPRCESKGMRAFIGEHEELCGRCQSWMNGV